MLSHWSLSDNKSPQVSKTLLSILADHKNAVVWMVSTHPLISKSSSLYTNPFVTVPRASIIIDIIATFMFHSFFQIPSNVEVFIPLFTFFQFHSVVCRDSKVHNFTSSGFFFCFCFCFYNYKIWSSGRYSVIRLYLISLYACFPSQLVVFHLSLSDGKSLQVSRTVLSILTDLNSVICMATIIPLISRSSSLFFSFFEITVTFVYWIFFSSPSCSGI